MGDVDFVDAVEACAEGVLLLTHAGVEDVFKHEFTCVERGCPGGGGGRIEFGLDL